MYENQIKRFQDCNQIIAKFGQTLKGIEFDEKTQAVEIYYLMSIKLAERHSKAISLLLQNNLPIEAFPLIRNLMESYFKLNWIVEPKNTNERIERVSKLEAHSFGEYEREMKIVSKHLDESYSFFSKKDYQRITSFLQKEKEQHPQLTITDEQGKLRYKSAPNFAQIMGNVFRVKYYHFYRFVCAYIHPSPFLKTFLLNYNLYKQKPKEIVFAPLSQSLAIGLKFIPLIMGYSIDIFKKFNIESHKSRIQYYYEIEKIAEEGYENYFA